MRSPAALLVLAASLAALPAGAEEPAPASATAPLPVPPLVAAPPPYAPPVAAPYYLPPPWWALPAPIKERHSKGMMITGIVFFAAGGIVTTAGLALLGITESGPCDLPARELSPPPPVGGGGPARHARSPHPAGEAVGTARQPFSSFCGDPDSVNVALGVLAAGVLGSGVGVPLFLVGNKKERPGAHPPDDAAVPALHLGAGSASLRWSF